MATRVNVVPASITEKFIYELRIRASDPTYFGDTYILDGWRGADYNNQVFLNSYLFGLPFDGKIQIEDRAFRPPLPPPTDGNDAEKLRTDSAITLILGEADTEEWMESGPGSLVMASNIPLIESFFFYKGDSLVPRSTPYTV